MLASCLPVPIMHPIGIDIEEYRTHGDHTLVAFLREMSRPIPWPMLEEWARSASAGQSRPLPVGSTLDARALAMGQRDQNIIRWWEPLHEAGFVVVDDEHRRLETMVGALECSRAHLQRPPRPLLEHPHRLGFFTHSLVGNALLLLTAPPGARFCGADGDEVGPAEIARHPNHHHLDNGVPIDLGCVVIVRHGQTEANERGILLGRSDSLDGWGAELLSNEPRDRPDGVESWHCSSLTRTRRTAAVFGVKDPAIHPGLDEMDLGVAEGLSARESIDGLWSVRLMQAGDPFVGIVDERGHEQAGPPGECFVELLLRVHRCLRDELGFVSRR